MKDENKTRDQLIDEVMELRQRIAELEALEVECKRVEEELAKERNFLNIVLDNLPLDVFVKDTESRFILANASTMRQLRVTTSEEYIGKTDFDFMPQSPEMAEEYFADEQKIIQTGEPLLNNEQTGIDPDGVQRWSLTSKLPLRDAGGNITGIVGIGLDIDERKRVAEKLQESEERLRGLSEASFEAIFLSEKGICLEQNQAAERMFGYTLDEAVGRYGAEWIVPEDREMVMHNMLSGYEEPYEITALCKDGTTFPAEICGRMMHYKGCAVRVTALRDITDRKQAAEEVYKLGQFLESVIDNANVWLNVLDNNANVMLWNKAAETISGYSREEVAGHGKIWEWLYPDEGYRKEITTELAEVIKGGQVDGDIETTIRCKDGQQRIIAWNERDLLDDKGNPTSSITIGIDVTKRRHAEQERFSFIREKERIEVLKRFVSDVSHDLRTPLSSINASLYVLKMLADPKMNLPQQETSEKQKEHLAILETQAAHLEKLIEDMFTMSRLDTMVDLELKTLNLNTLVRNVLTEHSNLQSRKQQNVEFTTGTDTPSLEGNEDYLGLAVGNIVLNALHYTPDEEAITIQIYEQEKQIIIEIQDNGIGISENDLSHIFERFYRGDEARNINISGTGLGLAIAQRIVELHQGKIEVESEEDKGTAFKILLPT